MRHFYCHFFPFRGKTSLSDIATFTSFFPKMASFNFNLLKGLVISIFHFLSPSYLISLPFYFSSSDDSTYTSLFESYYWYWWPSLSCFINSSSTLSMISYRRTLWKRSDSFISPFRTVSWILQVLGSLMDKEGFCKSIFSARTCWTHTKVLIVLCVHQ